MASQVDVSPTVDVGSLVNAAADGSMTVSVTSGGSPVPGHIFLSPTPLSHKSWQAYGTSATFDNLMDGGYYYLQVKPAVGGSTPPTPVYSAWTQATAATTSAPVELNSVVYGGGGISSNARIMSGNIL